MKKLLAFFVLLVLVLLALAKLGIIPVEAPPARQTKTPAKTKQAEKPKKKEKELNTGMKSAPAQQQGAAMDIMGDL